MCTVVRFTSVYFSTLLVDKTNDLSSLWLPPLLSSIFSRFTWKTLNEVVFNTQATKSVMHQMAQKQCNRKMCLLLLELGQFDTFFFRQKSRNFFQVSIWPRRKRWVGPIRFFVSHLNGQRLKKSSWKPLSFVALAITQETTRVFKTLNNRSEN